MATGAEPPAKRARSGVEKPETLSTCLVLVGMRAAGKSTFGKSAGEHFGCKFLDMDVLLEQKIFGCKVGAYVDEHGWPKFREAEAKLLDDILVRGAHLDGAAGSIVATGGGIVETPMAFELLKKHPTVLWIDRHVDDICRCLEGAGSYRPALGSSPREIYTRRLPLYKDCSKFVFTMRIGDENWPKLQRRFAYLVSWANCGGRHGAMANNICVPIVASTVESACADISEAACEGAGLVELRLDKLEGGVDTARTALPQLLGTAQRLGITVLATFRPKWEDPASSYTGEEAPRLQIQRLAAQLGVAFIDVEHKAVKAFQDIGGLPPTAHTKLVVSSHDFSRVWEVEELRSLATEMRGFAGPDGIVKVAQMAQSSTAAARMLVVLQEAGVGKAVALAMGEAGVFTRLLATRFGAAFTFGCLSGRASAPGQPSVSEMIELYRLGSVTPSTQVFAHLGAVGAEVQRARMFNAGFAAEDLDALYVPLPLHGCSLPEFLAALPQRLAGASVAEEHGGAALALAKDSDDTSKKHGAASILLPTQGGAGYVAQTPVITPECKDALVLSVLAEYALFRGATPTAVVEAAVRSETNK